MRQARSLMITKQHQTETYSSCTNNVPVKNLSCLKTMTFPKRMTNKQDGF